ncbi:MULTISPECIES: endonuclease domain-containing protein [unclassified Variovorax]|uniref:endonuclease domain-containing protein n=1 Tax=unclassified Variovorax TaxID=663243 RepID=UPI0008C5FC19|nr:MULTISPECIES: endonuclease domain-containing protein [unclassified Variovorax]SEI94309.1 Very-short-patch-repair endonuclease [Variovorax sp. OK202]SFB85581.1 adenine-specific DNA-methyltransferase [Variovorax sp. OK212]
MSEDQGAAGPLSRLRERVRVRARSLRETPTDAEALLWYHLRDRRLAEHKFRRQRPIGPYFADFACLEAKLVVELDGGQHVDAAAHDENRTRFIEAQGYRVLRFWNHEVLTQTDAVRERILRALQEDSPHPNPLPQAGEGARQQAAVPSDERAIQDTRNLKP